MLIPTAAFGIVSFIGDPPQCFTIQNFLRQRNTILYSQSSNLHKSANDGESINDFFRPSNAESQLLQLVQSHFVAKALLAFVRLGLQDVLDESKAMTMDEIINQTKPTPIRRDVLFRCLRLLCTAGVINESTRTADDVTQSAFSLTDIGMLLRASHPQSMEPFILHWIDDPLWDAWSHLPDYVTGDENAKPPFDTANNMSASEYYARNKDSKVHRNAVAKYASNKEISSILDVICSNSSPLLNEMSLSRKTIVDIGGGYGDLLMEIKGRVPTVAASYCLDLPDVIANAISTNNCKESTITFVEGDMFDHETIPQCDIIITKHVLCDFSDEDVKRALKSFNKVLSLSGKLVIIDAVLPNGEELNGKWNAAVSFDILLMLSGRRGERSTVEWSNLGAEAGFVLEKVLSTPSVTVDLAVFSKTD